MVELVGSAIQIEGAVKCFQVRNGRCFVEE